MAAGIPDLMHLADKQALYELVTSYCRAIDRRDWELLRSLYHPDAIQDLGPVFYGKAYDFVDFQPLPLLPFSITTHHITNAHFVVDGDAAEGECYLLASHIYREEPDRNLQVSGRYLDRFERRDGAWKFLHRIGMVDWASIPIDLIGASFDGTARPTWTGRIDRDDPSYTALACFGTSGTGA